MKFNEEFIEESRSMPVTFSTLFRTYPKIRLGINRLFEMEKQSMFAEILYQHFPFVESSKSLEDLETMVARIPSKRSDRIQRFKEARSKIPDKIAVPINPEKMLTYQQIIVKYIEEERFSEIPDLLEQMISMEPLDPFAWIFKSLVLQGLKYGTKTGGDSNKLTTKLNIFRRYKEFVSSQKSYGSIIQSWHNTINISTLNLHDYKFESFSESSKPVFEIKDDTGRFDGAILIKCLSDVEVFDYNLYVQYENPEDMTEGMDDLAIGIDYLIRVKESIVNHPKYRVPLISHFAMDPRFGFYYIMIRSPGTTLDDIIQNNASSLEKNLMDVADYMALQHATLSTDLSAKGLIDILSKMKSVVTNPDLTPNRDILDLISINYAPVINSFKYVGEVTNRDFHPEQFLVSEGEIFSLDWEDKGVVPWTFELANLLEYIGDIPDEMKLKVVNEGMHSFRKYSGKDLAQDQHHAHLAYWNSVIQRALSLCSAWSSPQRPSMRRRRKDVIDHALHAIDVIQKSFPDYTSRGDYKQNYDAIANGLHMVQEEIIINRTDWDILDDDMKETEKRMAEALSKVD